MHDNNDNIENCIKPHFSVIIKLILQNGRFTKIVIYIDVHNITLKNGLLLISYYLYH